MEAPIKTNQPTFTYKYYLIDKICEHEHKGWERGIDRIADLRALKDATINNCIYIDDEFEKFNVRFTIYYPLSTQDDEMMVATNFVGNETIKMRKCPNSNHWMENKYGQNLAPFEAVFKMPNI